MSDVLLLSALCAAYNSARNRLSNPWYYSISDLCNYESELREFNGAELSSMGYDGDSV